MIWPFNKKVQQCCSKEGELVFKKILLIHHDSRGKWTPNWEGPYVVKKAFSKGTLILTEMDGDDLPNPVNSDVVKKYYTWGVHKKKKVKRVKVENPKNGQFEHKGRHLCWKLEKTT